jgi:hypothetical protein
MSGKRAWSIKRKPRDCSRGFIVLGGNGTFALTLTLSLEGRGDECEMPAP